MNIHHEHNKYTYIVKNSYISYCVAKCTISTIISQTSLKDKNEPEYLKLSLISVKSNRNTVIGLFNLNICRFIQKSLSELANDATKKQVALATDQSAFKLRNTSRGLEFQDGIENFDNTSVHIICHTLFLLSKFTAYNFA